MAGTFRAGHSTTCSNNQEFRRLSIMYCKLRIHELMTTRLSPSILFLLFLLPALAFSQYGETLSTDRPGQAIGPSAVGKRTFQIQTGVNLNTLEYAADYSTTTLLSNTVVRFGLIERFELNGLVNWQRDNMKLGDEENNYSGISNTKLGGRFNFTQNKGILPAIGLQGSLLLKAQSKEYARDKLGTELILTTSNTVNSWFAISTNFGVTWNGEGDDPSSLYVINFGFSLCEKVGMIAEVYGSFNEFDANYDAGIYYLVSPDFMIDFTAGWQGDSDVTDWFADIGLSYRIDWRK